MGTIRTNDLHHRWCRSHFTDREGLQTAGRALPHAPILQPFLNKFSLCPIELQGWFLTY